MNSQDKKKRCDYQGLTYSDSTGLCVEDGCMVCVDGTWKEDPFHDVYPPTS